MKLSYNWLKRYLDIEQISPQNLADKITLAGLEVEGIETIAAASNLIIGEVISMKAHPDAEKLNITNVDIGKEVLQIVCGAPNVAVGQKVIVARVGSKLPELTIKATTIRGVESNGMICALQELGVNEKYLSASSMTGIEVLPADALVGSEEVLSYLGLDDTILDVGLTPNRSDCLAMDNIALDIGAIIDVPVKLPSLTNDYQEKDTKVKVSIKSGNGINIGAKLISGIVIKPSPTWIVNALRANGIKSINNIVDISNLVMLETGQPLHFYDANKLAKHELVINDGYDCKYTALDHFEHQLQPRDIVITSSDEIIGIAGIIGGEGSKIDDETTSVLIEAAQFDFVQIRTTARQLNVNTDASLRFSKELDPQAIVRAIKRATELLVEYGAATNIEKTIYAKPVDKAERKVVTSVDYINNRLGLELSSRQITDVFRRLSFEPVEIDNTIHTTIPSYRLDVTREVDLSEEVIRIIGYDQLPETMPLVRMTVGNVSEEISSRSMIKSILRGGGFNEVISYSLVSQKHLDRAAIDFKTAVEIANPLSDERRYYRTSLLPSMLDILSYNEARSNYEYQLYEIASVYNEEGESEERLSLALSNKVEISAWQNMVTIANFFTIKGRLMLLFNKLGINENRVELKSDLKTVLLHPMQAATIYIDKKMVGVAGLIHPEMQLEYDLNAVVIAELKLNELYKLKKAKVGYREIPRYPGVSRDVALVVDQNVLADDLIRTIKRYGTGLVEDCRVFDVYQGDKIEEGKKSLAIRISYLSLEKTLTDADVRAVHDKIIDELIKQHNVIYRV